MNTFAGASINKKNNSFLKFFSGVLILVVLVGVLNIFSGPIKNLFHFVSLPFEKYFWDAGGNTSVFFASFVNAGNIAKENENLKIENQNLLVKIASLQCLQEENLALKSAVATEAPKEYNLAMARMIGFDQFEDIISIDKGSAEGIFEGMPVISGQKVVFGKVLKVYENFSEVVLISNKNSVLNVKVGDIYGVTKGNGNLGIFLDMVPIDSKINEGEIVTTSSLEGTFPKDLLVGQVKKIEKNDLKPFQTIEIKPFFDINGSENLFIITNYKQKQ